MFTTYHEACFETELNYPLHPSYINLVDGFADFNFLLQMVVSLYLQFKTANSHSPRK